MSDPRYWAWWQDKLSGVDVPASEGTPYAGFYRWMRNSGYGTKKWGVPVAYWPGEEGELNCRVGFRDVTPEQGRDLWVNVCDNPVAEDWYREVTEEDPPSLVWRDGLGTTPPAQDNLPPDENDFDWLKSQIEETAPTAQEMLEGPAITSQLQADQIANVADRLQELCKKADEARKAERKPHDEELKRIQVKWSPLIALAEQYKNLKYKLLTPWQISLDKKAKEEAEAAAEAGQAPPSEPRRPRAGTRGKAMTLRTFKQAEIVDFAACLEFFKESPDIRITVQELANKAVRAGLTVPGVKVLEEQRTV